MNIAPIGSIVSYCFGLAGDGFISLCGELSKAFGESITVGRHIFFLECRSFCFCMCVC